MVVGDCLELAVTRVGSLCCDSTINTVPLTTNVPHLGKSNVGQLPCTRAKKGLPYHNFGDCVYTMKLHGGFW